MILTSRDILTHYPSVYYAVAWTELIICQSSNGSQTTWELLMSTEKPVPPEEIVEILKEVVEEEDIKDLPTKQKVLEDMGKSEFLKYIKGKAGCV